MKMITKILMMSLMSLTAATAFAGEAGDRASNHSHTRVVRDRLTTVASNTVTTPADQNTASAESTECSHNN